jgi:hypothetical protein
MTISVSSPSLNPDAMPGHRIAKQFLRYASAKLQPNMLSGEIASQFQSALLLRVKVAKVRREMVEGMVVQDPTDGLVQRHHRAMSGRPQNCIGCQTVKIYSNW